MTKQYRVRIKPDCAYGVRRQHAPGDELVVSDAELDAFGDKFIVLGGVNASGSKPEATAPEPEAVPDFDLKKATADEVVTAVADGTISAADALEAESGRSRPRKTVLDALTPEGS